MTGLPWSFHFERNPVRKVQYLSMLLGGPSKWKDDTEFRPLMLIDHETYKPHLLFPDVKPAPPGSRKPETYIEYRTDDGRTWRYRNLLLPMGEGLSTLAEDHVFNEDGSTKGRIWFTGPVVFPALFEVHGGVSEEIWMSITPMEIFTCRDGVDHASMYANNGQVVIAGLGLGWILEKVAALPQVEEIVVIERDKNLLDWYGAGLCAKTNKVTEVVNADYWQVAEQYPDHMHLIDIWPRIGQAYNDDRSKLRRLSTKNIDWWAWGYQYGEDEDNGNVLEEDEAISLQLGEDDEGEDDEDE